jgi:hypothetical protein
MQAYLNTMNTKRQQIERLKEYSISDLMADFPDMVAALGPKVFDTVMTVLINEEIEYLTGYQQNNFIISSFRLKAINFFRTLSFLVAVGSFFTLFPTPIFLATLNKCKGIIGFANLNLAASVAVIASCTLIVAYIALFIFDSRLNKKVMDIYEARRAVRIPNGYVKTPIRTKSKIEQSRVLVTPGVTPTTQDSESPEPLLHKGPEQLFN